MAAMNEEMQFLLYRAHDGDGVVQVYVRDETLWATQKAMADLFGVNRPAITKHLQNIFREGELDESSVCSILEHTASDGKKYESNFYNLDAVIAVGYRVNSRRATRFRQWATRVLNEFIRKGFVMDDERLKQGKAALGKDYFRELLERVRSIRASERRIWQQITDVFAECSLDYDRESEITREFYSMVQNKFHYAITGKTAPEIVWEGADHTRDHMGLQTWKNAPEGRVLKSDVTVAKNYLAEKQILRLERAVAGFFDYIEDLVERENTFTMKEFSASVNAFLAFRRYEILPDKGKVSRNQADAKAHAEYEIFNRTQLVDSDFDKEVRKMMEGGKGEGSFGAN